MSLCTTMQSLPLTTQNLCTVPFSTTGLTSRIVSWLGESQAALAIQPLPANPDNDSKTVEVPLPSARHSKEMCPQSYLDFAAKHNNEALASKEGITQTSVTSAIADAAHYVAAQDGRPVMSVYSDFENDRLRNDIHRSHRGYVTALNRRAAAHFRTCRITRPDMSKRSVPCKLQKSSCGRNRRCRSHAFCTLMQIEDASKAAYEAEQETVDSNAPAGKNSGQQPTE